jgi:hypothetical protein
VAPARERGVVSRGEADGPRRRLAGVDRWHDCDVSLPATGSLHRRPRPRVPLRERVSPGKRADQILVRVVVWLAVFALAATAFIALVHINDRSEVDQNPGAWMVQAQSVLNGQLVAPLNDDGALAGTRYQPPLILVLAGVERLIGGHPVLAWKLIALVAFVALVALIAAVGIRLDAPRWAVAAAVGTLAAFGPVHQVAVRSGADAIAFGIGLGAVVTLAWGRRRRSIQIAGAFAAIAILVKLTVVWPLIAGAIWLVRRRRALIAFVVSALLTLIVGFAAFQIGSSGRWLANMRVGLGSGGDDGVHGIGSAASRFAQAVGLQGVLGVAVLLAVVIVCLSALHGHVTLFQLSFGLAVATAVPLSTDVCVVSWSGSLVRAFTVVATAACFVHVVMLLSPLARAGAIVGGADRRSSDQVKPFGSLVPDGARLLSEDPTFVVLQGRRPAIGDPFMARRLFRRHPSWLTAFERRLQAHEFDRVILAAPGTKPAWWYSQVHLGTRFVDAVHANYEPIGRVAGYEVYRPRQARP